jgi:hypothetical protein
MTLEVLSAWEYVYALSVEGLATVESLQDGTDMEGSTIANIRLY